MSESQSSPYLGVDAPHPFLIFLVPVTHDDDLVLSKLLLLPGASGQTKQHPGTEYRPMGFDWSRHGEILSIQFLVKHHARGIKLRLRKPPEDINGASLPQVKISQDHLTSF